MGTSSWEICCACVNSNLRGDHAIIFARGGGIFKFVNKNMTGKFFFCVLFLWLVLNAVFVVPNKKNLYCAVCGKCCKQKLNSTRNSLPQSALLESCFGVLREGTGILCSTCRRALYIYRTTGKTSFQVIFLQLLISQVASKILQFLISQLASKTQIILKSTVPNLFWFY